MIPKSWKDITIGQFQQMKEVEQGFYNLSIEKELALLSVVTGISTDELEGLSRKDLVTYSHATLFTKEPIPEKITKSFRIGARIFKLNLKVESITSEQFILINKYTESENGAIENLHQLIAALSNEVTIRGKRKWDYEFESKADLFRGKLSIAIAYPFSLFFCNVYKAWLSATQTYLEQKSKQMKARAKKKLETLNQQPR